MATTSDANVGEILSACIDAAQRAGSIITTVWKSGKLDIKEKGADDPFTKADVESQQLIMGLLATRWPTLKMVGEEQCSIPPIDEKPRVDMVDLSQVPEAYQKVPISDMCVFIDPLDATREYTAGILEAVTTLIGISVQGKPIAGVIFQPFVEDGRGRLVWGMTGMGTKGCTHVVPNRSGLVVAITRSHGSEATDKGVQRLGATEVLRVGGAGYKALLVLEGKADVFLFATPGTKKWDTCAPEAIIRAAGGTLTDSRGATLQYFADSDVQNNEGVLCTMSNHQHYVDLINPK